MNRLKKELKKRGISLRRFKFENACILAEIFKGDWNAQEIVNFLLDSKVNCFHQRKSKFAKMEAKRFDGGEDEDWFYTRFLDEMMKDVDKNIVSSRIKFDDRLSLYT